MAQIIEATSLPQIEQARTLFAEYRAQLACTLCSVSFDQEIAGLPGVYAAPQGKLLLAIVAGQPVGCAGLRPFPRQGTCEMKRLYIRPAFRGAGLARALMHRLLAEARTMGYSSVRLDSHPPTMKEAIEMYRQAGFREVSSDPLEPSEELIYMELALSPP